MSSSRRRRFRNRGRRRNDRLLDLYARLVRFLEKYGAEGAVPKLSGRARGTVVLDPEQLRATATVRSEEEEARIRELRSTAKSIPFGPYVWGSPSTKSPGDV